MSDYPRTAKQLAPSYEIELQWYEGEAIGGSYGRRSSLGEWPDEATAQADAERIAADLDPEITDVWVVELTNSGRRNVGHYPAN